MSAGGTEKKAKEVELKIVWRLHKHADDPRFIELGKKLEELKEKHYRNAITSLEFLKELLKLARETVALERETKAEPVDNSKEALTKLFEEARVEKTPVIIKQIVEDIDEVVKVTRFDGWQWSARWRERNPKSPPKNPAKIPATQGTRTFRQGLQIHQRTLLRSRKAFRNPKSQPRPKYKGNWRS